MPPRTRSTTTTTPAGRRPKVAGLRAPGRRGVSTESGPASGRPVETEPEDPTTRDAPVTASAPETVDAPSGAPVDGATDTTTPDAEPEGDAPAATPAVGTGTESEERGAAARPTPKARRTGRTMTPSPSAPEPSPRRGGGTALLERPAPGRRTRPVAEESGGGSRVGRIAAAVTRPVAGLGANPRRLMTVLAVVLVLSLGLGTWAFVAARSDRAEGTAYANEAVVNVAGTAEVVGQTRQAIEQILSYDFTKLDDSVNAAKSQATGSFASEYLSVFEQTIRKPATDQKLRQTATVLNIGVQQLSSDNATLLALVQFTAERTTNGQTTNAPGLLTVQVVKEDGRWKISELKPV
ncbi:hypothetical protein [Actinomycetospora sp. NBRC 106378]|uniref:hypothetical protein n=1 Tax=Actinomycetospora sp. NBRC 106378 TaxID=3032208 RepID=UPI0024A38F1E|nr:hypothetical protein [Actinomycetospora sp. NBRC 106378]GLZ50823.1 hypothetical protein Acsp07_04400 [Actinomycetospora sp. NBRC 106378]